MMSGCPGLPGASSFFLITPHLFPFPFHLVSRRLSGKKGLAFPSPLKFLSPTSYPSASHSFLLPPLSPINLLTSATRLITIRSLTSHSASSTTTLPHEPNSASAEAVGGCVRKLVSAKGGWGCEGSGWRVLGSAPLRAYAYMLKGPVDQGEGRLNRLRKLIVRLSHLGVVARRQPCVKKRRRRKKMLLGWRVLWRCFSGCFWSLFWGHFFDPFSGHFFAQIFAHFLARF